MLRLSRLQNRRSALLNPPCRQRLSHLPGGTSREARRFSAGYSGLDILHANGVGANQPRASEERAPPWENPCVFSTRPARAGVASDPKVTLIECHLITLPQRSELCLNSGLRPCRAQAPGQAQCLSEIPLPRPAVLVPEGHPRIAHRFNGGSGRAKESSPAGTAERKAEIQRLCPAFCHPFGTWGHSTAKPSVETLGYSRMSLRDNGRRPGQGNFRKALVLAAIPWGDPSGPCLPWHWRLNLQPQRGCGTKPRVGAGPTLGFAPQPLWGWSFPPLVKAPAARLIPAWANGPGHDRKSAKGLKVMRPLINTVASARCKKFSFITALKAACGKRRDGR